MVKHKVRFASPRVEVEAPRLKSVNCLGSGSCKAQLRELVVAIGNVAQIPLTRAAGMLGVTPRTLQRRLSAEGTTYRAVLDEVGLELAAEALTRASACETAALLGFSEMRAFHRAFKRWTGTTPKEYTASASTRLPLHAAANGTFKRRTDDVDVPHQ